MKTKCPLKRARLAVAGAGILAASAAQATFVGTDTDLNLFPATGGMGGVFAARPIEPAAALFGNPATLTQYGAGPTHSFGATFFKPQVRDTHDGSVTGTAWSAESDASDYLLPTVAATGPLSERAVGGLGLGLISGLGSDFRDAPGSLRPVSELIIFGANAGIGYKVNDRFTVGAAGTLAFSLLQAGLFDNTASVHDYGFRGTFGASYAAGATTFGGYYRTPLRFTFNKLIQTGGTLTAPEYTDVDVEQPQELGIGVANTSFMDGKLMLGLDVKWKNWESADFYEGIYRDQTVYALGAQLTNGNLRYRIGYNYAKSPQKTPDADISNLGGIQSVFVPALGAAAPMNQGLAQYIAATLAEVYWEDRVSLGIGWTPRKGFDIDAHVALALNADAQVGGTRVEMDSWQAGVGFVWSY